MKYFTSDYHFGHPSIIEYCGRKFRNIDRMTEVYIKDANQRASTKNDTIYHIGDFSCWGSEKGVEGSKVKANEYLKRFNANVILIEGNHDSGNRVKALMKSCTMDIGKWKNVSLGHYPSNYKEAKGTFVPGTLRLCGHVHGYGAWRWCWDAKHQVLNINVGIDHWKHIVSISEVLNYAEAIVCKLNREKSKLKRFFQKLMFGFNQVPDNQFPDGMPVITTYGDRMKTGLVSKHK